MSDKYIDEPVFVTEGKMLKIGVWCQEEGKGWEWKTYSLEEWNKLFPKKQIIVTG